MKKKSTSDLPKQCFMMDSCVIFDFQKVESLRVVELFGRHCGQVFASSKATGPGGEYRSLDEQECLTLGLVIVEPEFAQYEEASILRRASGISFYDATYLVQSRDAGFQLITNDRKLQRAADDHAVSWIRGLRMMTMLVQRQKIPPREAFRIAHAIKECSDGYVTAEILADFCKDIGYEPRLAAAPHPRTKRAPSV